MKKMKKILLVILVLCMLFALCACGAKQEAAKPADEVPVADDTVYRWDWASASSPNGLMHIIAQDMVDEIYEATDGRLEITLHPVGSLPFATSEFLQAVSDGSIAMANGNLSTISQNLKSGAIPALPYLIETTDDLDVAMACLEDEIAEELGVFGVGLASYYAYPGQQIFGTGEAPADISDIAGMKIRTQGVEQSAWLQCNDINPVTIDFSEVTTSASRGLIDGFITAAMTVVGENMYDVVDWAYMCNVNAVACYNLVNVEMLNELPEDIRETFLEINKRYSEEVYPQRIADYENDSLADLEEKGVVLVYASAAEREELTAKIKPYWDEWCAEKGEGVAEDLAETAAALGIQ